MNVRQMWAAKLAGLSVPQSGSARGRRSVSVITKANLGGGQTAGHIGFEGQVLGIDPSLRGTGLAVVEFRTGRMPVLLHCRTVTIPQRVPMSEALATIHRAVSAALDGREVRHVAVEQSIYVQNFQTAQILGSARGAAIAAAALRGLPIFEYGPTRIKQAVVGTGRASKEQMQKMVMGLVGHGATLAPDEADAAGAALCHAFTWKPVASTLR